MAKSNLKRYQEKRDFSMTPEPKGTRGKDAGHRYLIQKHAATRLHYDFRLELDGVLKSWAVTRGPSLNPHDKRLAVEVEDHPVDYGFFEGIIPKGQYGGGTVMLWDEGSWEPIGDARKDLAKGKLEFILHGERLQGEWTLVRMRDQDKDSNKSKEERHNWLLIKRSDAAARPDDNGRLLTENMTSVASSRTMEEIAGAQDRVWRSRKSRSSALPEFMPPQLATLADALPRGGQWVHEVKFDGYRALAYLDHGDVTLFTRTGQDWTHKFAAIAVLLEKFPVQTAILDGEIVALDDQGVSSFKALQNALGKGRGNTLQYYVFDLLYVNGDDLRKLPLLERKIKLQALLKKPIANRIIYSEHFTGQSGDFLERLCKLQMEGAVSKRADAPYENRRSKSWLKTKCHKRQEFVIGGFTLPTHAERGVGALLIGYYSEEQLVYAGKVGTGFNNETSLRLRKRLDALAQKEKPFADVPADGRRGANWVKPELVCEIEFTEWTGDGRLRHPSFQGLREDKPADTISRDNPTAKRSAIMPVSRSRNSGGTTIGGIAISHPGRIIYPGTAITKQRLAEYYLAAGGYILPFVKGRPLSMIRCPGGIGEECFFQRHIARGQSPYLCDTGITVKGRNETYLMIKDLKGLLALVQFGVIELHPWGCLADKPDQPDRMIFDLDPAPGVSWEFVVEAAREIRMRMQEFGLESFVKTTGGKGLHVTIPLVRSYGWPAIKAFARAIADSMTRDNPGRYIAKAGKAERTGKIFVDYLRNDLTSTAVAPYSVRAREGAPVAMPIAWEQLKHSLDPSMFTVDTVPRRLQRRRNDPWEEFHRLHQKIPSRYLKALAIA